jgi:hypothetical protein
MSTFHFGKPANALPPAVGGLGRCVALVLAGLCTVQVALAQDAIYRCGNEYTNTRPEPSRRDCKQISGGNVTVVQGVRPKVAAASPAKGGAAGKASSAEQQSRDNDARLILQGELQKTQARLDELRREYNNGEPERRGDETRNYQKYLDRVAELKANIGRLENDVAGINRELGRLGSGQATVTAQ